MAMRLKHEVNKKAKQHFDKWVKELYDDLDLENEKDMRSVLILLSELFKRHAHEFRNKDES